jgi:hypothetical protein
VIGFNKNKDTTIYLMTKFCTNCGTPTKEDSRVCSQCGHEIKQKRTKIAPISNTAFFKSRDLLEMCDIICELEHTYNVPENKGYFDLFMLLKNLFDVISFYTYSNGTLSRIAEFFLFVSMFFQVRISINSERLRDRIDKLLEVVRELLKKQNIFDTIDSVKALTTIPTIEEKDKTEQHMKSVAWRLGSFTNITLRTDISIDHTLVQALIELLDLVRKGIYGPEGMEGIRHAFIKFKNDWEPLSQPYKEVKDFGISPILMDMPYTLGEVSKVLNL